jgi:hypothetical protein
MPKAVFGGTLWAKGGLEMSTISHGPEQLASAPRRLNVRSLVPEVWASLAIGAMWLAVTVCAIWGPDITAWSNDGNHTIIPSAVVVALFAWLGTRAVARYGFRKDED